jgi:O-antigen/teichoic acid export membrane protein
MKGAAVPAAPPLSLRRNFVILSAAQTLGRLLAFAVTVHLTRRLQADGFGAIAFATSVLAGAALVVDLGFDSLGPLEVARGRTPVPALARTVVALRLMLTVPALLALALFTWLTPVPATTKAVVLLYGLSLLANAIDLSWVFLGAERMGAVAAAELAQQALTAAAVFALVREPDHLLRMPFLFLAGRTAAVLWLILSARRRWGALRPSVDRDLLRRLLPAALPFAGAAAVAVVLTYFDLVLVGVWLGTTAAGLYGAAYRVLWLPTMLITAYLTALRPSVARRAADGPAALFVLLGGSAPIVVGLGLAAAGAGMLLAPAIVDVLYGPAYRGAVGPLRLLLLSFAFLVVSRHYRLALVASGRQATDLRIMAAAAALNVGLNLWLVPRAGLLGAAGANVASEAAILAAVLWAARMR